MRRRLRPVEAAIVVATLLVAAAVGVAAQERRRAANGAIVPTPEIAKLDCDAMQATLDAIDRTDYRGAAPVPEGDPDREIFDYENDLSEETYTRCITPRSVLQDASEAFRFGFEAETAPAAAAAAAAPAPVEAGAAIAAPAEPAAPAVGASSADEQ